MTHGCFARAPGQTMVLGPPRSSPDCTDAPASLGSACMSLAALAFHIDVRHREVCHLLPDDGFRGGILGFRALENSCFLSGKRDHALLWRTRSYAICRLLSWLSCRAECLLFLCPCCLCRVSS